MTLHETRDDEDQTIGGLNTTPSSIISSDFFEVTIPVPYINLKKLFSSSSDGIAIRSDPQYTTNYLNDVAKRIDFLHKNYVRYLNKLGNESELTKATNHPTTNTEENHNPSSTPFQQRIYPIVLRNKFQLGKELLMRDLQDSMDKCQLRTEMYKQQIRTLSKFIPPPFFLYSSKYSPYYWVLTDIDYKLMPPFLRNYVLYSSTSYASAVGSMFHSPWMMNEGYFGGGADTRFLTPSRTGGQPSRQERSANDNPFINRINYEWGLFIHQNGSITHRFDFLYNAFLNQHKYVVHNKKEDDAHKEEFEMQCYKLLKRRRRVARSKIKTIRLKHIRPSEREKSQIRSQYMKLKQLVLSD